MAEKIEKSIFKIPYGLLLFILVSVALLPFLGFRVLRMAGDEKVYISQAIEMARNGQWFVQTLGEVPDYYKGPLHYILLRIGFLVFGNSLWAVTYMNYLFVLLCGFSFYFLGNRLWSKESGFILGLAAALNVGVISHSYASQMEVELCGLYALATFFLAYSHFNNLKSLSQQSVYSNDLGFWVIAGITGWVKSPLHAVLIGLGGLLFWVLTGQILKKAKSIGAWLAALSGVLLSIVGYLPAYLLDYENFNRIFLGRENFQKPDNGRDIDYVLRSLPHFMFPWTFAVLGTFIASLRLFKNVILKDGFIKKLRQWFFPHNDQFDVHTLGSLLGLSMSLPTILFFCWFPYKGQNYNLPAIGPLLLLGFAHYKEFPLWSYRWASLVGLVSAVGLLVIGQHFFPGFALPEWWSFGWFFSTIIFSFLFFLIFFKAQKIEILALGAVCFFLGFGTLITPLGQWEMRGIQEFKKKHPTFQFYYYNLEPTIWSEWGLLQTVLHTKIQGLHRHDQISELLKSDQVLIVPGNEALHFLKMHLSKQNLKIEDFEIESWPRWLTKGKDPTSGQSLFQKAWRMRDISYLQRDFYFLWKH